MYYVYITASISRVIYVGVTNDLHLRVKEHKVGSNSKAFTTRYRVNRLVFFETYKQVYDAIDREKQLKRWSRKKKVSLIEEDNPEWRDLSLDPRFELGSR